MSQQRRNTILIELIPNQYYTQLKEAKRDAPLSKIKLAPLQIKKLEIYKSYKQHITDVVLEVDNIDSTVLVQWADGKYIAKLRIAPDVDADTNAAVENFFACVEMKRKFVDIQYATFGDDTSSAIVTLQSITRRRLEIENNFTFELGGRNGKQAAGRGKLPLEFLESDLQLLYNRNYMDEGYDMTSPWDMMYCDFMSAEHQVKTAPPNGYSIITETNMQALEYFFEHYPLFNTPYGWLLDDFSTGGFSASHMKISDFAWWLAWEYGKQKELSNILSIKIPDNSGDPIKASQSFNSASAIRYFEIQKTEHLSYYDFIKFYIKDGFPKIWATDIGSNKPISMAVWNSIHEKSRVLTPTGNVKSIPNPMYKEYLTFMTSKEIEESQLYLNMFQELHPTMEKYSFSNIHIGEVDIQTVVEFKKESTSDLEPLDRLGMGYQVLHTYTRESLLPKEFSDYTGETQMDKDPQTSQFSFSYKLTTEIIFLVIDKGDLTIERSGNEDASRVTPVIDSKPDAYYQAELCIDEAGNIVPRTPTGQIDGTDGVGIPGNGSIADQGQLMIDGGFRYIYGHKSSPATGLDCSGFTSLAIKRAGIVGYPNGTANQKPWCANNGTLITKAGAKRGDIVFFRWMGNTSFGHTGIIVDGQKYIHSTGGSKNTINNPGVGAKTSSYAAYPEKIMAIYRLKEK